MSDKVIRLPGTAHRDIAMLLPWYVTGRLDADEAARVDAHLAGCAICRDDLDRERRLDRALVAPMGVDAGWAAMRDRLGLDGRRPQRAARDWRAAAPRWFGWAAAAQLAAAAAVGVVVLRPADPARYRALGAAVTPAPGNVIIIFRPEARESELRKALRASDARLVDGPTAANAYVVRVPAARRDARLAELRASSSVVLAEPLDGGNRR